MKLKSTLLTILSGALLATSAKAIVYSDVDIFNGLSGRMVTSTNPLNDAFQISNQDSDGIFDLVGYNPLTQQIYGGTASFLVYDDSLLDGQESVTINLGSGTFVDGEAATYLFKVGGMTGSALFDLSADGVLAYSILATKGDFLAVSATLTVDAGRRGVPDGGSTAVLLGIGFLGIYAVQRTRKLALAH